MNKPIAVVCINEKDFMNHVQQVESVMGIINGKAVTNDGKILLMVNDIRCIRGLKLSGCELTKEFKSLERQRMVLELLSSVKTRVVK